jgi:hypothetical protein
MEITAMHLKEVGGGCETFGIEHMGYSAIILMLLVTS